MRTSLRAAIAITVALAALVIASMASATTPSPDTPVASSPGIGTPAPSPDGPQIVQPRPGMADVRSTAFDTATIGDDDRTVTIAFWSGIEPCAVLDHIDVAYSADAVTITLYQGHDPNAGDVACIEIAVLKQTTVTLDEPLAGRAIVDGAA